MPLVMWPMGTCSSDRPGKSGVHMARDTWPCSDDTALARRDSFSARIVMQNPSSGSDGLTRPSASSSSALRPMRCAQRTEVLLDERRREAIVAGRHRRVRREHHLRRDSAQRFGGADAFGLHALARQLERGKRAVPFVEVDDAGRDAERRQRLDPADAEQQLLADADAIVAAVEPRRQAAIFGLIAVDVGIEQQQRVPADGQLPHARDERAGARVDADGDRLAARVHRRLERQQRAVDIAVVLLLIARSSRTAA